MKKIICTTACLVILVTASCSKKLDISNMERDRHSKSNGAILIQESHIDEVHNLQVTAFFLNENGEHQDFGTLKVNGIDVPKIDNSYSGDDFSSDLIGEKVQISIQNNAGEIIATDSIYLMDAIQATMPNKITVGSQIKWNVDEEGSVSTTEIELNYSSSSLYNETQGFEDAFITREVLGGDGSYIMDESFFKDVPDGAWVGLHVSRTVEKVMTINYRDRTYNYTCTWLSTDMHTLQVKY